MTTISNQHPLTPITEDTQTIELIGSEVTIWIDGNEYVMSRDRYSGKFQIESSKRTTARLH